MTANKPRFTEFGKIKVIRRPDGQLRVECVTVLPNGDETVDSCSLAEIMQAMRYETLIDRFEAQTGELHGSDDYVANWKFTLKMRYDQGEYDQFHYSYLLGLLEEIEKVTR